MNVYGRKYPSRVFYWDFVSVCPPYISTLSPSKSVSSNTLCQYFHWTTAIVFNLYEVFRFNKVFTLKTAANNNITFTCLFSILPLILLLHTYTHTRAHTHNSYNLFISIQCGFSFSFLINLIRTVVPLSLTFTVKLRDLRAIYMSSALYRITT